MCLVRKWFGGLVFRVHVDVIEIVSGGGRMGTSQLIRVVIAAVISGLIMALMIKGKSHDDGGSLRLPTQACSCPRELAGWWAGGGRKEEGGES